MAKVSSVLFNKISGTVAGSANFRTKKSVIHLQKKPIPTDKKSPAQLSQRSAYRKTVNAWKKLNQTAKDIYKQISKRYNVNNFSTFLKFYVTLFKYNPIHLYGFDEMTENYAKDYCSDAVNLTLNAVQTLQLSTHKPALYFDGTNSYATANDIIPLNARDSFTILILLKNLNSMGNFGYILKAMQSTPNLNGIDIRYFKTNNYIMLRRAVEGISPGITAPNLTDTMAMYCFVYDGDAYYIYINCELYASRNDVREMPEIHPTTYLFTDETIRYKATATTSLIAIYPTALTERQQKDIYNSIQALFIV